MSAPKDPIRKELWKQRLSQSTLRITQTNEWKEKNKKIMEQRSQNLTWLWKNRKSTSETWLNCCCDHCGKPFHIRPYELKRSTHNFCNNNCKNEWQKVNLIGNKSYNWKGGTTALYNLIRANSRMDDWKNAIFKRDNYCDWFSGCKSTKRNNLVAHHIIPFHKLLKKYNIKSVEEAIACDALWDINNGITMFVTSHRAYHCMYGVDYE